MEGFEPLGAGPTEGPRVPGQGCVDDMFPIASTHAGIQRRALDLARFPLAHGVSLRPDKTFHVCLNYSGQGTPPKLRVPV